MTEWVSDASPTLTIGGSAPAQPQLPRGFAIGRYIIVDLLGSGGMGAVYTAYDPELDRRIALKLLHAETREGESIATRRERLVREAQALAQLAHPNVVAIHDVGSAEAGVFIAMELVVGRTLRVWLREIDGRRWKRVAAPFLAAGEGLAAAHRAGIVHRDFKPDNVVVGDDGRVRVLDFGLALGRGVALTDAEIVGTPPYMAPEQLAEGLVDHRSDQFAYCVVLYEALYGKRPFAGATMEEMRASIGAGVPSDGPSDRRVPKRVRRAIRRGLSTDPAGRHETMEALLAELRGNPLGAGPRIAIAASLVAVVAAASGGLVARARASTASLCGGGEGQASQVWNDDVRGRIHAAFTSTQRPFAEDAFRSVERTVEAYVPRWLAMRRDACEATRVRGEQSEELLDLRMACLDGALGHLREEVAIFEAASPAVVERAPAAAQQLPLLATCADGARLLGAPPLPTSKDARRDFDRLSNDLARARSLAITGDLRAAVEGAERVLAESGVDRLPRIRSAALVLRGRTRTNLGMSIEAEGDLWQAALDALREHDDERAVEAWGLLVFVQGSQLAHYADADRTSELALATMVRLGDADGLRGALLRNRAAYLVDAGRYDEATPLVDEALVRMERALGSEHPNYAATLETKAILLHARGQNAAALAAHERVLALRQSLGGPNHPLVAVTLFNIALVKASLGRHADALIDCERAMRVASAVSTGDAPSVVNAIECMAAQHRELGEITTARDLDRDLLQRIHDAGHDDSSEVGYAFQGLAADAVRAGDGASAIREATRGIASLRASFGADHPSVSETEELLGRALFLSNRMDEALSTLAHVESERERLKLSNPSSRASLLCMRGEIFFRRGDVGRALRIFEEARALLESSDEEGDPLDTADARAWIAKALVEGETDRPRARELAMSAAAAYAARGRGAEVRLQEMDDLVGRLDDDRRRGHLALKSP